MTVFWVGFTGIAAVVLGLLLGGLPRALRDKGGASAPPGPAGAKFCRDCRWAAPYREFPLYRPDFSFGRCMHPSSVRNLGDLLASGQRLPKNQHYCSVARVSTYETGICGPDGNHWEQVT